MAKKNGEDSSQDKDLELDAADSGSQETPVVTQPADTAKGIQLINEQADEIARLKTLLRDKEKEVPVPVSKGSDELSTLKAQVELLTKLVTSQQQNITAIGTSNGKRSLWKQPTEEDQQEEFVTFTARLVMFMVISYVDSKGLERISPFKPIVFSYAASDIRKDGKEDDIINFCQYSTNLKAEIEFLRNSPQYGIAFAENMNDAANFDAKSMEFRTKAVQDITPLSGDTIYSLAGKYKISKYMERSVTELRQMLIQILTDEYRTQQENLDKSRKERLMVSQNADV